MARWGFFITFEGVEGSGKSTLASALAQDLENLGFKVVLTREPGGTPVGEEIRKVLLHRGHEMEGWTEAFLFFAARYQHVRRVILPALQNSRIVISDRFSDSTFAYQGYGRGVPLRLLQRLNKLATLGIQPNLTFLLDLPPSEGLQRKDRNHGEITRFEEEQLRFHERIREGYLKLAHRAKKRFRVLDGTQPLETLQQEVLTITLRRLREKGKYRGPIPLYDLKPESQSQKQEDEP